MNRHRPKIIFLLLALLIVGACVLYISRSTICSGDDQIEADSTVNELFGIHLDKFTIDTCVVESGETLSAILAKYGVGATTTDKIGKVSDSVFSVRNIRADHQYVALLEQCDSTKRLAHLIYQENVTDFVIFSIFNSDSVTVTRDCKDVITKREKRTGKITSSLWNAMAEGEMPPSLAMELSEIFAWSVDFFELQKGDHFTVIYDNQYVDSTNVGAGRIWGAIFNHNGKDYYAIPFMKDGKLTYWDQDGNSLRKNLLKAPLKFSRISSRFSNSRLHPIYKIRRPHHGVDYAAPIGTPVHAVADGVVIQKGYRGGAGHMVKIKHSGNLMSGYLHLRNYANNTVMGRRVNQGDIIGYVGSSGASTGAHLDFRIWRNGKPVDPLKIPTQPAEPLAKEKMPDFNIIKNSIMTELKGDVPDSVKITQLDQRPFTTPTTSPAVPNAN